MTEKFVPIDQTSTENGFQNLDLFGGLVCDVETGICGPVDEINKKQETEEEKKNANYNMV